MSFLSMVGLPFIACLVMVAILSYLGIHIIKREVIFIDIAVAQVAALGAVFAHVIFHVHGDSYKALMIAIMATILIAAFFAVVKRHIINLPIEATIGITYALSAAGALFLVGKSTAGHTHVQEMLAGSLLWVTWGNIVEFTIVCFLSGLFFYLFRGPLQAISDNYNKVDKNNAVGFLWDFIFYALCGIIVTFSVRLAGIVVVFCLLIIPASTSALLAVKWRTRFIISWVVGVLASFIGLIFCSLFDFSAGVSVALFLGLFFVVVALYARIINSKLR